MSSSVILAPPPPSLFVSASLPDLQLTLRFLDGKGDEQTDLSMAFNAQRSVALAGLLRLVTVLIVLANVAFVAYDYALFDWATVFPLLMLRLVVVVPVCAVIVVFSLTRWYLRYPSLLAVPSLALGGAIIAYSAVVDDPGYGTLAVLIAYLYWYAKLYWFLVYVLPTARPSSRCGLVLGSLLCIGIYDIFTLAVLRARTRIGAVLLFYLRPRPRRLRALWA